MPPRSPMVLVASLACLGPFAVDASAQFNDKWASFAPSPASLPTGSTLSDDQHETDLAWGDLDLDGDVDLVVVRKQPFTTTTGRTNVLLVNEGGVLVDRTATLAAASDVPGDQGFLTPTNDRDVALGDLDGDGYPDVVTATEQSPGQPKHVSHPRVYLNLGSPAGSWLGLRHEDARFPLLLHLGTGLAHEPRLAAVDVGDLDGDGDLDLYLGDHDTGLSLFGALQPKNEDLDDRLLLNDGNGYFTDGTIGALTPPMIASGFCNSVELVDVNQDGAVDIVKQVTYQNPEAVSVAYNDPAAPGVFQSLVQAPLPAPYFLSTGDLDGDGRLDLAVTSNEDDYVVRNQGNLPDGTVDWSSAIPLGHLAEGEPVGPIGLSYGSNNLVVDLDGDGAAELLVADVDVEIAQYDPTFRLQLYHGRGTGPGDVQLVEERESPAAGGWVGAHGLLPDDLRWTHDVAAFDVDGDGLRDLVLSRREGTQVWLQVAPPSCQTDLGEGADLVLEACGGDLSTGTTAQLRLLAGAPGTTAFLALGAVAQPQPLPSLGITLVPAPLLALVPVPLDGTGSFTWTVPGGGGPQTVVLQAFQLAPGGASISSSNGLELQLLP